MAYTEKIVNNRPVRGPNDTLSGAVARAIFSQRLYSPMPKFTYDTDKSPEEVFGVPLGSYVARFLGDEEVPPFDGPSKFKQAGPPEPRLAWKFEVTEPASHRGKVFRQISGNRPTGPKSNYVKVLKGLLGRLPMKGEVIDTDSFKNRLYRIEVEENPQSDSGNYHIAYMAPHAASAAPASTAAPPPPARERQFYIGDGQGSPDLYGEAAIRAALTANPALAERWQYCEVGGTAWKPIVGSFFLEGKEAAAPAPPP